MIIIIVALIFIVGGGAVFFLKKRGNVDVVKDFSASVGIQNNQIASVQNLNQQFQQPIAQQPVVNQSQSTIINQWTDEAGYTWRSLSDGTMEWWTGSDWKKR